MVGRKYEVDILKDLLKTNESEFLTIIGRRRVGKTYLIREVYREEIIFEFVGMQNSNQEKQLSNFQYALLRYFPDHVNTHKSLSSWLEAFQTLIFLIECHPITAKPVIFIDELPWLATPKSEFLEALGFFWNSWASKNNIVLATCGSAASWMIQKVILNKGGLHNRVTKQIFLQPFNLRETRTYLESRDIVLSNYQIVQLYMVFGGIPFYLKQVQKGMSVAQIVESLFFDTKAPLKNEFINLYASLFNNHERYVRIIETCFSKWSGITQVDLVTALGISSGGSLTRMLYELEVSGFIEISNPYKNKKKGSLIRLVDSFSIFYLKFIKNATSLDWQATVKTSSYQAWQGYAFENICFSHVPQIKEKLGIRAVQTRVHSYNKKAKHGEIGAQIDMFIDRNDDIINCIEVKFSNKPYTINKDYQEKLHRKIQVLQHATTPDKSIHLTMITSYGIKVNKYHPMVQSEVVMDDLFV